MNEPVEIATLGANNVAHMRGMLAMFGVAFEDVDTYTKQQPDDEYLSQLLADRNFIAIAALSGDQVVGGLAAYVLRKFEQARSEVYIYDLAVDESYRRQGIATKLISVVQVVAKSRGAYVVFVQADIVDAPAVALYSKLGTREDVLHFDIDAADGVGASTND